MITNTCNLACPYCFGMEQMTPRVAREDMTRETFLSLLDWLGRSGESYIHLMGGEPTRHPEFQWMLDRTAERGIKVDVFSNGITDFSPEEFEHARTLTKTWIVNINDPRKYPPVLRAKLERLFASHRAQVVPTFNIMNTRYEPSHLFEYINGYGLQRVVKLGIALPTLHGVNDHARPAEFAKLASSVVALSALFKREGVRAEFECGVPHCFFSETDKAELERNGFNHHSGCSSILDILPSGDVIYCLPLARSLRLNFRDFATYPDLRRRMHDHFLPYRSVGYRRQCLGCEMKPACQGSCLARIMPAFADAATG